MKILILLFFTVSFFSCAQEGAIKGTVEQETEELFQFTKEVLSAIKTKDYEKLKSFYITEEEVEKTFALYDKGHIAKREYEENLLMMTEDRMERMSDGYFFKAEPFEIECIEAKYFDMVTLGEVLNAKSTKSGVEYYFTEVMVVVKNNGIDPSRKQDKRLKVGELIKTEKGWRILKGLGWM